MLSRDQLLGLAKTKAVHFEDGSVSVRELSGRQREIYLEKMTEGGFLNLPPGLQAQLACWCVVDEHGKRIFDDTDLDSINDMSGTRLQEIVLAILDVSGLTVESVENLEKNSESESSVEAGSDSQKLSAVP